MPRIFILIGLFFLSNCSTPQRTIASKMDPLVFDEVDEAQSLVRFFPPHYIYLELRNPKGELTDVDPEKVTLKSKKSKSSSYLFERSGQGRYYLSFKLSPDEIKHLDIFIDGKKIREKLVLSRLVPVAKHSKIKILAKYGSFYLLRLSLADSKNRAVESKPEILLDGVGSLSELYFVKPGVWEFELRLPDDNQLVYLAARAQGVVLPQLLRLQHIEK
jgi:hypothetical protein